MHLLLTPKVIQQLHKELRKAGNREIGGLIMGEHLHDETFKIVDISVQRHGGDIACFIRHPKDHANYIKAFFRRTKNDYTRFNYLGEWHSHPLFQAIPSTTDIASMQEIVKEPDNNINFAILLVVKLVQEKLELSVTAFHPQNISIPITLSYENEILLKDKKRSLIKRIITLGLGSS